MQHVTVLGGGLSGLAAAQRARQNGHSVTLYEASPYLGGHAATHHIETRAGRFLFDEGPHVSFTKNPVIKDLFASGVDGAFYEHAAQVTNYWHSHWVLHPAQCNLHALPRDVVERCLLDFIRAAHTEKHESTDYADWCYQGLGKAFSEEFTFPYTRKYWTADASQMTTDWVGSRVKAPSIEEVVRGALGPQDTNLHYITQFRYPQQGGFGSYAQSVMSDADMRLGKRIVSVDPKRKEISFADGGQEFYDALISSLPLPELIGCIKDAPTQVREAVSKLVCTSLVLVNVALARTDGFPDAHWMYVYDEDMLPSRIHFPHRLSPANTPDGCGSIQCEVYHSPYRPLTTKDVLSKTLEDLQKIGLLRHDDEILAAKAMPIRYANVLFDQNRATSLAIVRAFLAENNILACGRFGEWEYHWTDDSVLSGWRVADTVKSEHNVN